jgi:hypothetical protein
MRNEANSMIPHKQQSRLLRATVSLMNTLNIFHSEFDCVLQLHPPTFLVDLIDRSLSEVQALYVSSIEILLDLDGGKKLMT